MENPKFKKYGILEVVAGIIQLCVYFVFPDANPFISSIPGVLISVICLSAYIAKKVIYWTYGPKFNNLIKENKILKDDITAIRKQANEARISLNMYDDSLDSIITELTQASFYSRDENEKNTRNSIKMLIISKWMKLLTETNRKKVNVNEFKDS